MGGKHVVMLEKTRYWTGLAAACLAAAGWAVAGLVLAGGLALGPAGPAAAWTQSSSLVDAEGARRGVSEGRYTPLDRIVDDIRRREPGILLDGDLVEQGGGEAVYRIKWLTPYDERVEFIVDARTGAILERRSPR